MRQKQNLTATDQRFVDDILEILSHARGGEESVSHVLSEMRYKGWKNLGSGNSAFEDMVEEVGFTLKRVPSAKNPIYTRLTLITL